MKNKVLSVLLVLFILMLSSCGAGGEVKETTASPSPEQTAEAKDETTAAEEQIAVGLYEMTSYTAGVNEEYTLLESYTDTLAYGVDICVLSGLPCGAEKVSGFTFRGVYENALSQNPDASGLRLGYTVEYKAGGKDVKNDVFTPADINEDNFKYVEIYVYDDVNRSVGEWYSHLLPEEYNAQTVISSVKLTPGDNFKEVSDIKLTAFLYDPASPSEDSIKGSYTITVTPDASR